MTDAVRTRIAELLARYTDHDPTVVAALPALLNIVAVMQQEVEDCAVCQGTGEEPQWRLRGTPRPCSACKLFRDALARFAAETR